MQPTPFTPEKVQRLLPLLASIAREVCERTRASETLQAKIDGFAQQQRRRRRELDQLWAEYAVHQRELRLVQKELERLGCRSFGEWPWHVALQDAQGVVVYEGALDRTAFLPRPPVTRA